MERGGDRESESANKQVRNLGPNTAKKGQSTHKDRNDAKTQRDGGEVAVKVQGRRRRPLRWMVAVVEMESEALAEKREEGRGQMEKVARRSAKAEGERAR
jgi:hypothetical protein